MLVHRHRLALEQRAPKRVVFVPNVHRCDVNGFVIHQCVDALARGKSFKRLAERRDVDGDCIVGR